MSRLGVCSSGTALASATATGAKHIRCDAPWGDLAACEKMLAASQGKWWPLLGYSNPATGTWNRKPSTQDVADYASWCAEFAEHFRGRIEHIELRNEPNLSMFWDPQTTQTPVLAASMTNLAIRAIRKVNPDVTIVGCAIADADATAKVSHATFFRKYWTELIDTKNVVPNIHAYNSPSAFYREAAAIAKRRVAVTEVGVMASVPGHTAAVRTKVEHLVEQNAYAVIGYSWDDPDWALGAAVSAFA